MLRGLMVCETNSKPIVSFQKGISAGRIEEHVLFLFQTLKLKGFTMVDFICGMKLIN